MIRRERAKRNSFNKKALCRSGAKFVCILLTTSLLSSCSPQVKTGTNPEELVNDITEQEQKDTDESKAELTAQPNNNTANSDENMQQPTPQAGTAEIITPAAQPTPEAASDNTAVRQSDPVLNNGGLYVKYQGNVYYRQYTAESLDATGIWGEYYPIAGMSKNMMVLKEDGTTEVAFEDTGAGIIYISNGHMFLQKPDEKQTIYSVDLDGKNYKECGSGYIAGIDEVSGILVCKLLNESGELQLSTINTYTGKVEHINLSTPCSEVLTVKDGYVYYQGAMEYEDSVFGKMKLCRVNVNGTDETILAENDNILYEYETYGTDIPCLQIVGDTIYFSYGGYAGTGYYYQGGQIAKVNTDGSNFEILAGQFTDIANKYDSLVDESFYVTEEDGKETLYYTQSEMEYSFALDLVSKEVTSSDFPVYEEGKPFEYEGGINIYRNASPEMTTLIPKVDYSLLGLESKIDYYYTIKNIELCDNWVYYKLEANISEPEVSIGWREGYRRVKTQIVREELNGSLKEVLYEY